MHLRNHWPLAFSLPCYLFAFLAMSLPSAAQTTAPNEWTWMGGSSLSASGDQPGVYGTLGAPGAGNAPGGRTSAVSWTDNKGNLWLFGGYGYDSARVWGYLDDLWEFNSSTDQWAWMGGSSTLPTPGGLVNEGLPGVYGTLQTPARGNIPGSRTGASGWTDTKGNLWLFGGFGFDSASHQGHLNDLWEFDPSTGEWAWMGGSSTLPPSCGSLCGAPGVYGALGTPAAGNIPGGRQTATTWTDGSGNLWLFGGSGFDSGGTWGYLNDLWMFSPSTSVWTWVGGSSTIYVSPGKPGVYGTKGTPAAGNIPGGRSGATGWTDKSGNLWLFGGMGLDASSDGSGGYLNDVWQFVPAKGEWAWMGGSSTVPKYLYNPVGQPGVYGTLQTLAADNTPGGRTGAVGWADSHGGLWLFGGYGSDAAGTWGYLNDLWEFNPSIGEWEWMSGSGEVPTDCPYDDNNGFTGYCGSPGVYGMFQTPAFGNTPGGRESSAAWTDKNGNFWLMGGSGYDSGDTLGNLNDLWELPMNAAGLAVAATPAFSSASGTYTNWQTVTISDSTPGAVINYIIDGNTPASIYSGPITVSSSETIEAVASASGYADSAVATASYVANLPTAAAPTFSPAPGTYRTAQTVTISDTTSGATIYYAIGQAPTLASSVYSGPITVSSSETIEAIAVANGYLNGGVATAPYTIWPNPTLGEWAWMGGSSTIPTSCGVGSCGPIGVYGTLGKPAAGNMPGGRLGANAWVDAGGHFWVFGGNELDADGQYSYMNDLWEFDPSSNLWAWMGGSTTAQSFPTGGWGQPGVYGLLGKAAAGDVPGGRQYATSWTDQNGHFWLFGGMGFDANGIWGYPNDLWEFDPTTQLWTWMAGSSTVPALASGSPGIYGILDAPAPGNTPGGRANTQSWIDRNGHLWMYGGSGFASNYECTLNDLWEFDPSTREWTWRGGNPNCNGAGGFFPVYGAPGVPGTGNTPWSLATATSWTDSGGHLWLFGGEGEAPDGTGYYINELWEFDPSISEWAFMGGGGTLAVYGTMGSFAPQNISGSREYGVGWTDAHGNLWLFGGQETGSSLNIGQGGALNDLWEFSPATNEWAWMSGNIHTSGAGGWSNGAYGALGTPSQTSLPGGRLYATSWTDSQGNLWLFGGEGADSAGKIGFLNDLWEFQPSLGILPLASSPTFSVASGTYLTPQTVTISDTTAGATIYYTTNGTTPTASSAVYSGAITVSSAETLEAIATASGYSASAISSAWYTFTSPPAAPTFSPAGGTYTSPQAVTISDSTTGSTIYYTMDGTTPTTGSTLYAPSGDIWVSATETIKAIAIIPITSGYSSSAAASATYTINLPAPDFSVAATPASQTVTGGQNASTTISIAPAENFNSPVSFACTGLPSGSTCSFSPSTVTPSGGAASTTLTINTTTAEAGLHRNTRPLFPAAVLAALLCCFGLRKRRRLLLLVLILSAAGPGLLTACGGGGSGSSGNSGGGGGGGGSQSATYTITVNATSGSLQHATTFTMTVD